MYNDIVMQYGFSYIILSDKASWKTVFPTHAKFWLLFAVEIPCESDKYIKIIKYKSNYKLTTSKHCLHNYTKTIKIKVKISTCMS